LLRFTEKSFENSAASNVAGRGLNCGTNEARYRGSGTAAVISSGWNGDWGTDQGRLVPAAVFKAGRKRCQECPD